MGLSLGRGLVPNVIVTNVKKAIQGTKRKYEEDDSEGELNCAIEESLQTPKKKKLVSTAQYIYTALFKEGRNSDVTVEALSETWKLHKIYLCQSPYFSSMFGGSWIETDQSYIPIEILDPQITKESLDAVFGSLYLDNLELEPNGVVGVLAAATLFQLEDLIAQCCEVMAESLNHLTAVRYFEAAKEYGVKRLKDACFSWMLVNLLNYFSEHPKGLIDIGVDLMASLIASPDLFVIQTEFSSYALLKLWIFRHEHPVWDRSEFTTANLDEFFAGRQDALPYLLSSQGQKYASAFRALRVRHLLINDSDVESVIRDNILPADWLVPAFRDQWRFLLRVSQNLDRGPKEMADSDFFRNCIRFARVLPLDAKQMWRWTGFLFGMDLVLIADGHSLWLKRNHRPENEHLLSFQVERHLVVRVSVASIDDQRRIRHRQSTGVQKITLTKNQEYPLLMFDKEITFPLLISMNIMLTTPIADSDVPSPQYDMVVIREVE